MERDAELTKLAILTAAEEVFARQGFDGASLQQVGDAAGVSRSTPGYFFGSKTALYEAVLARVVDRAQTAMLNAHQEVGSSTAPDEAVAVYVTALLDFLAHDQGYLRLIQREALGGASRIASLIGPPIEDTLVALAPAAEQAGITPQRLLLDVFALCWYPFAHEHTLLPALDITPRDRTFNEDHKEHIVALIRGLMSDGPNT